MTIRRHVPSKAPAHRNPELKQGQTYRITGARSGSYQDYIGRYFVAAYCAGCQYLVYLHDNEDHGGYDSVNVVNSHGIEFVQVNVAEA